MPEVTRSEKRLPSRRIARKDTAIRPGMIQTCVSMKGWVAAIMSVDQPFIRSMSSTSMLRLLR